MSEKRHRQGRAPLPWGRPPPLSGLRAPPRNRPPELQRSRPRPSALLRALWVAVQDDGSPREALRWVCDVLCEPDRVQGSFSSVFVDINGSRAYDTVLKCVRWAERRWPSALRL